MIGCPNGTTGFTVTFVYVLQGGSDITTITGVSYGATIPKPDDPTREGFLFGGWYDADYTNAWDFETDIVTSNIMLYAKWIDTSFVTYTVTFNSLGGSSVAPRMNVNPGAKITKPADPTRNGYTFDGWYREAAFTNAWNFETDIVIGNIWLYAKWTPIISNPESFLGLTINETYSDVLNRFGNAFNETLIFTHAVVDNTGYSPTPVSLLEFGNGSIANVSNGELSLILGTPPSSQLLDPSDLSTLGFEITDGVKLCMISDFTTLDGNRIRWKKNDMNSNDFIALIYFDRDGTATGSGNISVSTLVTVDWEFKQGWNTVIFTYGDGSITQVTAVPDLDIFK